MEIAKLPAALAVTLGLLGAGALAVVASDGPSPSPRTSGPTAGGPLEPLTLRCTTGTAPAAAARTRAADFVLGPLTLVGVLDAADERGARWRRVDGHDPGWSTPVVLRSGATVTLRVPRSAGTIAAFAYGPKRLTVARVRDGLPAVRFRGCDRTAGDGGEATATSWPGGLVVSGRSCVPVDITVGRGRTMRVELGMGRGNCLTRPVAAP